MSRSHITGAKKGNIANSTNRDIKHTPSPTFAISLDGILQGAAAMALGGVDTGRQYAKEQHNEVGNIR